MPTSPTPRTAPAARPLRKPMAVARRVALFEREIRWKLSAAAVEILFESAEVLSEGQREGARYYGSTMITIELGRAGQAIREPCDAASARRVAELCRRDPRVRARAREIAVAEAEKRAGERPTRFDVDLDARAVGTRIHIDLDVEGNLPPNPPGR